MKRTSIIVLALAAVLMTAFLLWAQEPPKPAAPPQAKAPAAAETPLPATPAVPEGKTRFVGTIANTGGTIFLGGYFSVEIDQWTTPEEADQLKKLLVQSGQQALLDKVWKAKQIGYLKVQNSMGKPLFFARAIPVPGGLIVRALTNSPLGRGYGRAGDYPFGFIELIIPNEGKGYGTIVGMAKISIKPDGSANVEGYGTIPEKLMDVEIEKKKK
jgi:hypothetical protein